MIFNTAFWTPTRISLAVILLLATVLRIYNIDFQSPWVDELLTMKETHPDRTLAQLYHDILFWEQMPHLYFFLVHFTFEIFGFSVLVGRMLSAVFGILGVFGVYLLGRELYSRQAGLVSALVMAINGFHIAYSQEMRPYALFFLFSVLSFYRLVLFLKKPDRRNAIWYGVFTGLIVHGHMFGLVTIFAQAVLLLIFLLHQPAVARPDFLKKALISAGVALLVIAPGFQAVIHVLTFKSFWLAPPSPTVYTDLFSELLNNSEIVVFLFQLMFVALFIAVITKRTTADGPRVLRDRLLFPATVLAIWTVITLLLPLLKSHLDVSMIISRYFISLSAVLALMAGIAIQFIRARFIQIMVLAILVTFMLTDLLAVRKYYYTVTKSEVTELMQDIANVNHEKHKIVTFWSWLLPQFFKEDPALIDPVSQSLDQYVDKLRNGQEPVGPFWFANANSRPFSLTPENVEFLVANYNLKHEFDRHDAWAKHYVPKNAPRPKHPGELSLVDFKPGLVAPDGKMTLFAEIELRSGIMHLEDANYVLELTGQSSPKVPLNGENAHITVKWNNNVIGSTHFSEQSASTHKFKIPKDLERTGMFTIHYDNDFFQDGKDRNLILERVSLNRE